MNGATRPRVRLAQRLATEAGIRLPDTDGNLDWATKRFVRMFQDVFQLGPYRTSDRLSVDGIPGRNTEAAILLCLDNSLKLSTNFALPEFRTKGSIAVNRRNQGILVTRDQVRALQRLRRMIGQPLVLLSTYRDPTHNARVGGVSNSQHLFGRAADIDRPRTGREITEAEARRAGFGGVGMWQRRQPGRHVIHVDTRPNAARWYYQ